MSDIIEYGGKIQNVLCNSCKHFHFEDFEHISCDAFKDIPKEILTGRNRHLEPLPGQKNDIVFEQIKP